MSAPSFYAKNKQLLKKVQYYSFGVSNLFVELFCGTFVCLLGHLYEADQRHVRWFKERRSTLLKGYHDDGDR